MREFNTPKTTALAPMASVSVRTAAIVNPGDLRKNTKAEAQILEQCREVIAAKRLMRLRSELFLTAEFDTGPALSFNTIKARAFKIVGAVLNVAANLFLNFSV